MDKIPDELLLGTFSYIKKKEDLKQICLTSRRFRNVATPFLYTDIHLQKPFQLTAFSRAISADPTLAAHIERLTCHSCPWWIDQAKQMHYDSYEDPDMRRNPLFEKYFSLPTPPFEAQLSNLDPVYLPYELDHLIPMILGVKHQELAPKLKSFNYVNTYARTYGSREVATEIYVPLVYSNWRPPSIGLIQEIHDLSRIQSFNLSAPQGPSRSRPIIFLDTVLKRLMALPSLKSVTVSDHDFYMFSSDPREVPYSSVEHLVLRRVHLHHTDISSCIKACRQLKIVLLHDALPRVDLGNSNFQCVIDALKRHKSTLEKVSIQFNGLVDSEEGVCSTAEVVMDGVDTSSLSRFPRLKALSLPQYTPSPGYVPGGDFMELLLDD